MVDLADAEEIAPGTSASAIVPQRLSRDPSFPVMISRAPKDTAIIHGWAASRLQDVSACVRSSKCSCVRTYVRVCVRTSVRAFVRVRVCVCACA